MPSRTTYQPTADEIRNRKIVGINSETVTNIASTDFPGHYVGEDHAWDVERFKDSFSVKYYENEPYEASFSLIGLDASVANAFRRILLAEIPTLAIETCFYTQNTSIIQDEVLAQRLGLIPLKANPKALDWMSIIPKSTPEQPNTATDRNTIIMKLQKTCTWNSKRRKDEDDPLKMYNNAHIYASDIEFFPQTDDQVKIFGDEGVTSVNPDILLMKMRPGQEIDVELHAVKGFGFDHAKFSPVATATYRLLPTIDILSPIVGQDAIKFQKCFPKGVIELEEVTDEEANKMDSEYDGLAGQQKAVVKDAFRDTVSRECLRHEEFQGKVKLGRVRDHFIFSIESIGQIRSDKLFLESVEVLKAKCQDLQRELVEVNWG